MELTPKIAVVTDSEYNFRKYVNSYGEHGKKYVQIDNKINLLPGTTFNNIVLIYGHEDVDLEIIKQLKRRL